MLALAQLENGQEADLFLLLADKHEAHTREGKPFWRVTFRDASLSITTPIWHDSPLAATCGQWQTGQFYKLRAAKQQTNFGAQLNIRKIRPTNDDDLAEGFDPLGLLPRSRYDAGEMFAQLVALAQQQISDVSLAALVSAILHEQREALCDLPGGLHHHDFRSGWLEHTLSVARNAVFLADKYAAIYPEQLPSLARDLVVAGAILHDIGKLIEIESTPAGARFTPRGELVGHMVLGRDIVREAAQRHPLSPEVLLRLEHIILSHQKTAEWGSPKPPMTLEALLVHYADDIDAKAQMLVEAIAEDSGDGWVTSRKNLLQQKLLKRLPEDFA